MRYSRLPLFVLAVSALWWSADSGRGDEPNARRTDGSATSPAPYFYVVAADPQLLFNQKDDRNWKATVDHLNGRLRASPQILRERAEVRELWLSGESLRPGHLHVEDEGQPDTHGAGRPEVGSHRNVLCGGGRGKEPGQT